VGVLPTPTTPEGRAGLEAILSDPARALLVFDYDGTLSPIVSDPAGALPEPGVVDRLGQLSARVAAVAIVTGRPAQQAVELGGLATADGLERLVVVGQYGLERWERSSGLRTVDPPPGVDQARRRLPALLASLDLADAYVEDKRLALVVHVRNVAHPEAASARMREPLAELAESTGLIAEPGRHVVELRPPGMDKGQALRTLMQQTHPAAVMFTGDDVGDLPAFAEVRRLREEDEIVAGLLVCSASDEVTAPAEQADLIVPGPAGVKALLGDLAAELSLRSG
jgi:trehalose 6-phosphate phosphatase